MTLTILPEILIPQLYLHTWRDLVAVPGIKILNFNLGHYKPMEIQLFATFFQGRK
jgi:hypothetical protein